MYKVKQTSSSLIDKLVEKRTWAIVGASEDSSKFGNKIYRDLKNAGYHVYGINPKGGEIAGQKLYPDLASLNNLVKFEDLVVDLVIPPAATEKIVQECKNLGIKSVWFQPGTENSQSIQFCQDNQIDVVYDACIMIQKKIWDKL